MQKFIRSSAAGVATFAVPFIVAAQSLQTTTSLISALVNYGIGLLIGIAIIAFFWGLIMYLFKSKGGEEGKKAYQMMVWGILALFVMLSVYGLVRLLQNTFGVGGNQIVPAPQIPNLQITQH